jgi:hypothetical protein
MAISLLAGGVGGGEFWRVVLAAVNNVFFSLSVGMFCSAISRDERKAMTAAFGLLLAFCLLLPLAGALIADARNARTPNPLFFIPSPSFTCVLAFDETARQMGRFWPNFYYISLATVHAIGWIFLTSACWIVPRTWHDKAQDSTAKRNVFTRWLFHGSPEARLRFRRALLDMNPFYWLTSRDRAKGSFVWLLPLLARHFGRGGSGNIAGRGTTRAHLSFRRC